MTASTERYAKNEKIIDATAEGLVIGGGCMMILGAVLFVGALLVGLWAEFVFNAPLVPHWLSTGFVIAVTAFLVGFGITRLGILLHG